MPLEAGHKLAHYEILSPIGAGGMGEVYRAKDSKLGRDVAIKVLPDEFAQDEERLRRFQREAKVLASLNHPNIAAIYGLEQSGDTHYLVLELVPGETLADRIARGPIPVEEALEIAKEIAEALEEAHERGIVHRDLKPANIKLTEDGKVKVLDFGLAKAFVEDGVEGDAATSISPTITKDATRVGVILGTAAYMSPEQAKGKAIDKRTDIFAFGVVLFEMLSGRKAFPGDDVSEVLASVIKSEPDFGALPVSVTPRLRELLHRCLDKDRSARLRDIGDGRYELQASLAQKETPPSRPVPRIFAALALLAAGLLAGMLLRNPPPLRDEVSRFTVTLESPVRAPVLSPDGRHLAFYKNDLLHLRAMDERDARPIDGSHNPQSVSLAFFSPDGEWVGFFKDGSVYRMRVAGGSPESIAFVGQNRGAAWGTDGTIVVGLPSSGLIGLPVEGGPSRDLTTLEENETSHRYPCFLPDGKHVLFTVGTNDGPRVGVASLETGTHRILVEGYGARYLPTGHLVFVRDGTLFAAPFSISELALKDAPTPLREQIRSVLNAGVAFAEYSISSTGSLAYVAGEETAGSDTRLVWVSRDGSSTPLGDDQGNFIYPRLAPNGGRLAVSRELDVGRNLWLYELERDANMRFLIEGNQFVSAWTADGRELAFNSDHAGRGIFVQSVDGSATGAPRSLRPGRTWPSSWSPDGRYLAIQEEHPETKTDIWILTLGSDGETETSVSFAVSNYEERAPAFSPDGRYLAFVSNETGRDEIYVQPFPGPGGKRIVSTDGGSEPVWAKDGRELFYRNGTWMVGVEIELSTELRIGQPVKLFESRFKPSSVGFPNYDVASDGRFVMIEPIVDTSVGEIEVVLNWSAELARLVPTDD